MKKILISILTVILVVSTAVLVACGEKETIDITFDGCGGVTASGETSIVVTVEIIDGEQAPFEYPVFTRLGHTFTGWDADVPSIRQDTTVYAQWRVSGKIDYDGNGGKTLNDETTVRVDFTTVTDIPNNEPTFTRDGYKFLGWNKTATQIYEELGENEVTVVKANWGKIISVTFDGDGGVTDDNQSSVTQDFVVGDDENLPFPVFNKSGFEMTTWYPHPADFTNDTDATQTVVAMWEPEEVYILYDGNGGLTATQESEVRVLYEGVATLNTKPNFVREGYQFLGWDKNDTQIGQQLTPGQDCRVAAKWGKIITVTFDGNGGVTADDKVWVEQEYIVGFDGNKSFPKFSKSGYNFAGWDIDPSTFTNDSDATRTVVAQWTQLELIVIKFDSRGGTVYKNYTLLKGNSTYTLPTPTRGNLQLGNDYSFVGWYYKADNESGEIKITSITKLWEIGKSEITLYAKWESNWIGPF